MNKLAPESQATSLPPERVRSRARDGACRRLPLRAAQASVLVSGFACVLAAVRVAPSAAQVQAPAPAAAMGGHNSAAGLSSELRWRPEWPRFRPVGYVLTGAAVLGALSVTLFVDYPAQTRWRGGFLFDDSLRDVLRARDPSLRAGVRTASDVLLFASIVQVGLLDGLFVPLLRENPEVATQLTLMNLQAFALNSLIATLLFKAVARERPLVADCRAQPSFDALCSSGPYASFPSSHAATAFTAAGLTCVHHAHLALYGGGWDTAACFESLSLAAATALFRVIGDRHYTSDVLAGALMGFAIGYLYPWLLHYRFAATPARSTSREAQPSLRVMPMPNGMGASLVF